MIEIIEFGGEKYPEFQAQGYAAKFAFPYAKILCEGEGFDIGCCKEEWVFPDATPIDLDFDDEYDAYNLPEGEKDYIFSSHCLEHLEDWVGALNYWTTKLKPGGTLFLYLPHKDQKYWRPWNNRKHYHMFQPSDIVSYLEDKDFTNIIHSERDLNHSFIVAATKTLNV